MIDKTRFVGVLNRSNCRLGYTIPDMNNLRRRFSPNERKEIEVEELIKLSYKDGGMELLKNFLIIQDKEVLEYILGSQEPEYFYTEKEVIKLLSEGTTDQLLDTFDFCGDGVVDLIKKVAVDLEISDLNKRDIIREKTDFDVSLAIAAKKEDEPVAVAQEKTRRSNPVNMETTPVEQPKRRANYTIVE